MSEGGELLLPDELKTVPKAALEKYISSRIREFSRVFVTQLLGPDASSLPVDVAYNQAVTILDAHHQQQPSTDTFALRFMHGCKFLGCMDKECQLCVNNPNKRCGDNDHFDECYADNQVLKSKCDADVSVQLVDGASGRPADLSGIEVQISVIDGESVDHTGSCRTDGFKELLRSDEGQVLLGAQVSGVKGDGCGRLLLTIQDGACRLPDVYVTDKTDTFHMDAHTYSSFRLVARALQRDLYGNAIMMERIAPAVSEKFIVKTQRALNDYRKSEYPHYKDELTKLKFIGSITAQRLRDIQAHIAAEVPFTSIETVEQLKHLMLYADQNRQVENKLLELLNMKGKHKHKWDYLREILLDKIVYDDMAHRAWFTDGAMSQGLLFACKQGQVNMEKPFGVAQRIVQGGQSRLQVLSPTDPQSQELMKAWKTLAEDAWSLPGHIGWTVVSEPLELVGLQGSGARGSPGQQMSLNLTGRHSLTDTMQNLVKRESSISAHQSLNFSPTGRTLHTQSVSGSEPQYLRVNSTSSAGGGPDHGNLFQFTAARSMRVTARERGSSGGGTPTRSERSAGVHPNPTVFSHMGRYGLEPESDQLSGGGGMFQPHLRPRPSSEAFSLQHRPSQETHAPPHRLSQEGGGQRLFPQYGGALSMFADADPNGLRVSSSPDVFMVMGQGGAQGGQGGNFRCPSMPNKSGLGLDLSNSEAFRQRGSRIRRMSATDAGMAQHLQSLQSLDREGIDQNALSKRPRASVPVESLEVDTGMDAVFVDAAPVRSPSKVALYHSESRGRHHPRSRMLMADPDFEFVEQQSPTRSTWAPPQQPRNLGQASEPSLSVADMDNLLADHSMSNLPLSGLPDPVVPVTSPAQAAQMHPSSPSQHLSSTMQHTLHLNEGQAQGGMGGYTPHNSWRQPEDADQLPGSRGPAQMMVCNPETLNKNLSRVLRHSDSDSFKHMLHEVDFLPSPSGNLDNAVGATEFAAFLEDHFSDPLHPRTDSADKH